MATMINPTETSVIIEGASWATYECLLEDFGDSRTTRMTYDQGTLEIMTPSYQHERLKSLLTTLFEAMATGLDLDFENAGSTTFKREEKARGFEPDACFYVQHVAAVRGKQRLDLTTDPPPDLVIEVDITHPSLGKLPIYAAVGVIEVWRCDGYQVHMHRLIDGQYEPAETSAILTGVTKADVNRLLDLSEEMTRAAWIRHIQAWAQSLE
ncbi:Uma2 family endonuclease [Candidatus Entotheonella palauensis]|uniref:Uma2 family endonuclease n=1 Tax=Candidatus Entotheonella palauensis TaxID=93172 RepID=UPI000B7FEF88|nr:Uma2 family endonuclease [Candidatus Entotheonella palauensis]